MAKDINEKVEEILSIITYDINQKGINKLVEVVSNDLYESALSIINHPNPHISILTGLFIHDAELPAAETDGVIGAIQIAKAFLNIGIQVNIVTDTLCYNVIKAALEGCNIEIITPVQQIPVGKSLEEYEDIFNITQKKWSESKPPVSHVISIGRAGLSYDGNIYNINAKDISQYTVPLDKFFSPTNDLSRISIADTGNEIGSGKLSHQIISENIKYGEFIACKTSSDYLIISGISNWGAYALIAVYSLFLEDEKKILFLKDFNQETDNAIIINAVNHGGAVDSITKESILSIDGVSQESNLIILNKIIEILKG